MSQNLKLIATITKDLKKNHQISNNTISTLIDIIEQQNRELQLLEKKSKLATMGEMMDTVAHQWKQPLNALTMMSDLLKNDFNNGLVDNEYIEDLTLNAETQINHLVNTLSEFRDFFKPNEDNKQLFSVHETLSSVKILMKDELVIQNVTLKEEIAPDLKIYGFENEFKHVFINLISNACEEFSIRKKLSRYIYIRAYTTSSETIIEVEDTAGGVDADIINKLFERNITKKAAKDGTGVGLYLVTQILDKHNATISVKNSHQGAFFTISLPKNTI